MSDALQHAILAVLIAAGGLLEVKRRRELDREARERAERLAAASRRTDDDPV